MEIKRYCMVIELKEEFIEDYKDIHINAWPELLKAEKDAGTQEELIWIYKNLAILYFECDDLDRIYRVLGDNEVEKKWNLVVLPWFKVSPVLDGSAHVEVAEKVFDLNQQLQGFLGQF